MTTPKRTRKKASTSPVVKNQNPMTALNRRQQRELVKQLVRMDYIKKSAKTAMEAYSDITLYSLLQGLLTVDDGSRLMEAFKNGRSSAKLDAAFERNFETLLEALNRAVETAGGQIQGEQERVPEYLDKILNSNNPLKELWGFLTTNIRDIELLEGPDGDD